MTSLTGAAPLPPLLTNPVATTAEGVPVVLTILSARAVGELNLSLLATLQSASGPGNVVTGSVEATSPDGTVTLATANGTSITVHHPPELPLELGSSVALRIIPTASAPQALLLAVNGRPVFARGTTAISDTPPVPAAPATAATIRAAPVPAAFGPASLAASFIATISLEDEAAIEAALGDDPLALGTATGETDAESLGPSLVAVLIRPAPAKLGQTPVASGTRYLVTLRGIAGADGAPLHAVAAMAARPSPSAASTIAPSIAPRPSGLSPSLLPLTVPLAPLGASEAPVSAAATVSPTPPEAVEEPAAVADLVAPEPEAIEAIDATIQPEPAPAEPPGSNSPPLRPIDPESPGSAIPLPEDEATGFRSQVSTLAGRVAMPRAPDETLVETALGTLALPLVAALPPGSAVQLRVTAVAPPLPAPHSVSLHSVSAAAEARLDAAPPSLIEELARALAPSGPGLVAEIHELLSLEPGGGLAAAIIGFLAGLRPTAAARGLDTPGRRALFDAGRKDLAARLDLVRGEIGTVRAPEGPDGWTVAVLPFLGAASIRPMRLYRKRHEDKDEEGKSRGKPSERFMLEVELKRLGPLQFDGLVRERRFDLVLRSRAPLVPGLERLVGQVFQDGLLITGWGGEIGFGRIGKFPMVAEPESSTRLDLGA